MKALNGLVDLIPIKTNLSMTQLTYQNQINNDNSTAIESLITSNIHLVISVARRFQNNGLLFPELINKGLWGLMTAAKNFNKSNGFEFNDYATWFIRQSIIQAIMEKEQTRPIPLNKIGQLSKSPIPFIKPGYYFQREPLNRDMEAVKNLQKRMTKGIFPSNNRYSEV
jgi:RNA polymerase primary sigma factor